MQINKRQKIYSPGFARFAGYGYVWQKSISAESTFVTFVATKVIGLRGYERGIIFNLNTYFKRHSREFFLWYFLFAEKKKVHPLA